MFVEPLEAGSKVCAAAYWAGRDALPRFENLDLVDGPIEVQNVHAFGSLTFEDRSHLGFKQTQLTRVHIFEAIDGDRTSPTPSRTTPGA